MLLTLEECRSTLSGLTRGRTDSYWRAAELALNKAWFLVSTSKPDRTEDSETPDFAGRTFLLFKTKDVTALLMMAGFGQIVCDSVQVVTPSHVNGGSGWQVDHLVAVWSADEPDVPEESVEMYEVGSGALYAFSMLGTPIDDLINKTLVFRIPRAP